MSKKELNIALGQSWITRGEYGVTVVRSEYHEVGGIPKVWHLSNRAIVDNYGRVFSDDRLSDYDLITLVSENTTDDETICASELMVNLRKDLKELEVSSIFREEEGHIPDVGLFRVEHKVVLLIDVIRMLDKHSSLIKPILKSE